MANKFLTPGDIAKLMDLPVRWKGAQPYHMTDLSVDEVEVALAAAGFKRNDTVFTNLIDAGLTAFDLLETITRKDGVSVSRLTRVEFLAKDSRCLLRPIEQNQVSYSFEYILA
jgi:hypothetical protein